MLREPTGSVGSSPHGLLLSSYLFDFDVVTVLTKLSGAGKVIVLTCQIMWYLWKIDMELCLPCNAKRANIFSLVMGRKRQNNKTSSGCGALILILQEECN